MKLIMNFFGTGSAFNTKLGANSAYIELENDFIFIDAGEGILEYVRAMTERMANKRIHVLITHMHPDHVASLGNIIFWCHFKLSNTPTIYFANDKIVQMLTLQGVNHEYYDYFEMDKAVQIGQSTLQYFEVKHYELLDSYGILFSTENEQIYYSGDANMVPGSIYEMFMNNEINEWYQDTSSYDYDSNPHISINQLIELVPVEKRKNVFCMHLDEWFNEDMALQLGFNVVKRMINNKKECF